MFMFGYDAIAVDDILYIYKYLMKKMIQCNKMSDFVKKFGMITIFIKFYERKFTELYFNFKATDC